MRTTLMRALPTVALSVAVGWGAGGCATEENGNQGGAGSAVVGTWNATSFIANGTDLIAAGMTLTFTLTSSETYSLSFTNDLGGFCDVGSACTENGDYTATDTQITLDAGTPDVVVLAYTIIGNTMSIAVTVDGTTITATFDKR